MVNVTYTDAAQLLVYDEDGKSHLYGTGDIAWVLTSTGLVMLMTPGVGYLYSGLLRRKNALSMVFLSVAVFAVVTFQWFFWGYSLTFSSTGGAYIGDLKHFGFINLMFAAVTPMILLGATAERGRIGPALVFTFVWSTLVYDPIAHWTWSPEGWLDKLGALDFAGGGPVHMTSGTGAMAYAIWLGKRNGYGTTALAYRPQNTTFVVLGTVFLWFGWYGFNAGSALSANLRATQALMASNLAGAVGGLTWMCLDWRLGYKWSAIGFCSGVVSGLASVTPASGYIGSPAALCIGVLAGILCNMATRIKSWLHYDDPTDVFAIHGVGGCLGSIMTAIFADNRVASFDGSPYISGGFVNHHYKQLAYQLAECASVMTYTFVVTMLILITMDFIPGLSLRVTEDGEFSGIDEDQIGEQGYDFVQLRSPALRLPQLTQVQFDKTQETASIDQ